MTVVKQNLQQVKSFFSDQQQISFFIAHVYQQNRNEF